MFVSQLFSFLLPRHQDYFLLLKMVLQFRPATAADAPLLAPLIYDSGPEAFQYVFNAGGKTALEFLQYSLQQQGGEFGHGCHTAVLLEGEIVAVGAEFSGSDSLSFLWNNALQILSFFPFPASLGVIRRGLQVERILVPPKKGVHYIAHLDTQQAFRGRGIGEQLILEFMRRAAQAGRNRIELDVAETNQRAEALYQRMGYERLHKRESRLERRGIRVPGYYRMKYRSA